MNIFAKVKKYHNSDFRKNVIETKKWFFFRWETALIIFATLIVALLNVLPNWIGNGKAIDFGDHERYIPNTLRDNLIYSSFSMGLTIIIAIFVGVYTEIGKYAGKYSSALFVLVPGLIWLFSDREDSHVEHIVDMSKALGALIFWSVAALAILYAVFTIAKHFAIAMVLADSSRERIEMWYNVFSRIAIVVVNILIMLMLSYGLINYAIFTIHLTDVSPEVLKDNPTMPPYDLHAEKFVTFHAIIAIFFAILMIAIGMSNIVVADVAVAVNPEDVELNPEMKTVDEIEKEAEDRVHDELDSEGV